MIRKCTISDKMIFLHSSSHTSSLHIYKPRASKHFFRLIWFNIEQLQCSICADFDLLSSRHCYAGLLSLAVNGGLQSEYIVVVDFLGELTSLWRALSAASSPSSARTLHRSSQALGGLVDYDAPLQTPPPFKTIAVFHRG